jgi:hypothetical protein
MRSRSARGKNWQSLSKSGTAPAKARLMLALRRWVLRDKAMNDASQMATATVAITFMTVLLVTGQWFVDNRQQREATAPVAAMAILHR